MPSSPRPRSLVLVCGTATEVGKTWVTARAAEILRAQGVTVAARKLAQSFADGDDEAGATDAHVLGAATGCDPEQVCPPHRWYPVPMAPPMAADALGRETFTVDDLVAELRWPEDQVDIGFVETVGGVRSPMADDGDAATLSEQLSPDVAVVVADASLGAINTVRLSVDALAKAAPEMAVVVVLNRFDPSSPTEVDERNRRWLGERDGFTVVTDPPTLAGLLQVRKDGRR